MKSTDVHLPFVSISIAEENHRKEITNPDEATNTNINILFWNISSLPEIQQIIICCCGIFLCYIPYGYLQELMFLTEGFKYHGWYLTLYQFLLNATLAFLERSTRSSSPPNRAPISLLFVLASLTVATMGLSNTAVGYLNYPTQVIFKCCKLIPVMIGGIIIQGKMYGALDFISMMLLSLGLILFMLADKKVSPEFNLTGESTTQGVSLISLALVADSMIGNFQEKIMKTYGASNVNMILYSYGIGFIYILVGCLATGKFFSAFMFFAEHPMQTYGYGFLFSVFGYIGMQMVLAMISICGALATVTLTTCRKAISIVLSFLLISKPFTWQYMWGGGIVLAGISLNIYNKNKGKFASIRQYLRVTIAQVLKHKGYSESYSNI